MTSCDEFRQVATSCDMTRRVATGRAGHSQKVQGPSGHCQRALGPSGSSIKPPSHSLTGFRDLQGTFRRPWDLPGTAADHRKRLQNYQNHENRRKWTQIARNGMRIRPFEAHSHSPSIANPPRPQIPPENSKNQHFPKNQKIQKSGNPPGSAAMGGAALISTGSLACKV